MFLGFVFFNSTYKNKIYHFLFIGLIILLSLRYGQGTDYFSYAYIFSHINSIEDVIYNPYDLHGEIGFRLLCFVFGSSYECFIVAVSIFEMLMLKSFIDKYSSNKLLTLLLFYPTFYLTYYFSAIREGIVISIFVGIMIPLIQEKKFFKFFCLSLLCTSIHTVAILTLFVPLFYKLDLKKLCIFNINCFVIGIFFYLINLGSIFSKIPIIGSYFISYNEKSLSYGTICERTLSLLIICILYYSSEKNKETNSNMLKLYLIGHLFYFVLMPFSLISSRALAIFKVIEIVLITQLISNKSKYSQLALLYFIALSFFMLFKNINSYIYQGNYYDWINEFNYPYISIFEKDTIFEYRGRSIYYDLLQ